jgi:hypothetical protein
MWEPRHLTTLWASGACYRDSFIFLLYLCVSVEQSARRKNDNRESFPEFNMLFFRSGSRNSLFGRAMGWTAEESVFVFRWGQKMLHFFAASRLPLVLSQLTTQWLPEAVSLRIKRSELETHHSLISSAEVEVSNACNHTSILPSVFMA